MKPPPLDYLRPETLGGALDALRAGPEVTVIAGGQSLLPMLSLRVTSPSLLVNLARLPELRLSEAAPDAMRIGAATTHAEIEDGKVPDPSRGMMAAVAAGIAYRAVRNFGTIGGAVALSDPAADWPACLVALGAAAILAGPERERRMPVADFVLGPYTTALQPREVVLAFEIPALGPQARWGWKKLARKRGAYADSIGAVVRPGLGAAPRVVLGATGDRPWLLDRVSRVMTEQALSRPVLREVITDEIRTFDPSIDSYRLRCHVAMVERAIFEASAP
ncbi:FAD binding domain-containing protein [Roseomonas chloroacetimidivorans]|uniref:FAD binding domain-containing protein n=1 Tax=Roseomonas chloroacetimidivorans TaxID=1766656 RepID=UPI003C74D301